MLELYPHNQKAYEAAAKMLALRQKAAIIHPTGTGKSIIAYKLVEEKPNSRFLWLSPSSYIMQVQRENVLRMEPNFDDSHVIYCTYARLMYMEQTELMQLRPDYIILDEFHRCGASEWGKGVQALLQTYPQAKILGLSATNIRYLDNYRDMAEELFDGLVASEMSIAEAIVLGILPTPTYVVSLYSYQNELEEYRRRVNSPYHRANFDTNQKYYEALRRALEQAEGLDVMFEKHMRDRSGKYILFCSGREHMETVCSLIPEWFGRVDAAPHIYEVWSENPDAETDFLEFQRDVSPHLKLLLCIDMLSEGIHVPGVSGVILIRPTISPVVYKQQIGRALAAGSAEHPLIFDIVNNFENLNSYADLQSDIDQIVFRFRENGIGEQIVNDHFTVIDEVREIRALIRQLEAGLSADWDAYYRIAEQYVREHGDLAVPVTYKTKNGFNLGTWLERQRQLCRGVSHGRLTPERIEKLDRLGMIWESHYNAQWERKYALAEQYYIEHGDLIVPTMYETENGVQLGRWIKRQLNDYQKGALSPDQIERLNTIGMCWDDYWMQKYKKVIAYLADHPIDSIRDTTTIGDFYVGRWLKKQYKDLQKNILPEERAQLLREIPDGVSFFAPDKGQTEWLQMFEQLKSYVQQNGSFQIQAAAEPEQVLEKWIRNQRRRFQLGKMKEWEREKLEEIGFPFYLKESAWMKTYSAAKTYFMEHGNLFVPVRYITEDGIKLGNWVRDQRVAYQNGKFYKGDKKYRLLSEIGMAWETPSASLRFSAAYAEAKAFFDVHGHLNVPTDYIAENNFPLGAWIQSKRENKRHLTEKQIRLLDEIGMTWNEPASPDRTFERIYKELYQFYQEHGTLETLGNRSNLTRWLRKWRNDPSLLSESQREKLNAIGMRWERTLADARFQDGLRQARVYYQEHGDLLVPDGYVSPDGYPLGEWITYQRRYKAQMAESRIQELDKVGMQWRFGREPIRFETGYRAAQEYYAEHGNLDAPEDYVTEDGVALGFWLKKKRSQKSSLTPDQAQKLQAMGMTWREQHRPIRFASGFRAAQQYYSRYGHLQVPEEYVTEDGFELGWWINEKKKYKRKLSADQIDQLNQIGMQW